MTLTFSIYSIAIIISFVSFENHPPNHNILCSALFSSDLMETVELKVEMVGIHEKRVRKCLSKIRGIEKVEVDANSHKVAVSGYAHRNKILKALRRGGFKADFWSAQNELLSAYSYTSAATYGTLRFTTFNFNFF